MFNRTRKYFVDDPRNNWVIVVTTSDENVHASAKQNVTDSNAWLSPLNRKCMETSQNNTSVTNWAGNCLIS